jgi:hypothetical protein
VTATPDVRLDDPPRAYATVEVGCGRGRRASGVPVQMVTPEQLDRAVLQLRERRNRTAAEQMQAVLRALELTVAPRNEHRR